MLGLHTSATLRAIFNCKQDKLRLDQYCEHLKFWRVSTILVRLLWEREGNYECELLINILQRDMSMSYHWPINSKAHNQYP